MAEVFQNPALLVAYGLLQMIGFLLIIRLLDTYEREPMWIIGLMGAWGGTFAVGIAILGNEAISAALPVDVDAVFGAALSAPLVEELSKGAALLAAFFVSRSLFKRFGRMEFEGVTDGIVYGAAVGFGFAFTEDILYLFNNAYISNDLGVGIDVFMMRVDFFGLNSLGHAIYTGTFGAGLGMATWATTQRARIGWPLLGLAIGMFMHAMHNGLISLILVSKFGFKTTADAFMGGTFPIEFVERFDAAAASAESMMKLADGLFVLAFFTAIIMWVRYQKKVIAFELAEEVNNGLITKEEWAIMPTFIERTKWYFHLLKTGHLDTLHAASDAHRELADLAFAKWRTRRTGGDPSVVERHRDRVRRIRATQAAAAAAVAAAHTPSQ